MIISHALRCVFVHIQKTGGSSIELALRARDAGIVANHDRNVERHAHARTIRAHMPAAQWQQYYKFAFVRNPWDRLVSWYAMCVQVTAPNDFARYVQTHTRNFADFVTTATTGVAERTTWNQLDYLCDADGSLLVDYVGRYESLADDFAKVGGALGVAAALPHANRSRHRDYREYYTAETQAIVAARFARDIERFDYRF
jgi:chondroitin 4-sulfotransferase 11